jgi:hypothetical protein
LQRYAPPGQQNATLVKLRAQFAQLPALDKLQTTSQLAPALLP